MKRQLACLCVFALAGCVSPPSDIVRINPKYIGPDEMQLQDASAAGMAYTFRSQRGIYSFDILPIPTSVKAVVFVLQDQRMLSSLSIHPPEGNWTSLYDANVQGPDGVQVLRKGNDWHVSFSGLGLDLLRQGGRFQVIDVHRQ